MQTSRKVAENLGLIIVPLVMVLIGGVLLRSMTTEPVAQAKSAPAQPNDSAPNLPGAVPDAGSAYGNEIPNPSFASSLVNGLTFYAGNFRLDNASHLLVDLCFDQNDNGDWTIWNSHLTDAQGHEAALAGGDLLEIRFPPTTLDGKSKQRIMDFRGKTSNDVKDYYRDAVSGQTKGQRCVTATYNLPSGFDSSKFTVTVDSIMNYPNEGEQCSDTVRLKIQKILDEKKTGIKTKLKADQTKGGGMCGVEVAQKPNDMSQDQAQSIATGNEMFLELFGIQGPWVFEGSIK